MKIISIAAIAHAINAAYCASQGDLSQPTWDDAPEWQQQSAIAGVEMHLANPDATPEQAHESWLEQKIADGWVYGAVKDPDAKTHPCCVPYEELPVEQKAKDYLFRAVVHALKDIPDAEDAVAQALASLPSPILTTEGVQAGYIGVQYIGRRDYWQDTLYSSGLTFTKGQARSVPQIVARKLLRHPDLFKQVEGTVAASDDTAEQLEQGAKTSDKREAERRDFAVIDQMNQISTKAGLAEFALAQFGIKLNMRDKLEDMRETVTQHITRFGAQ